jgi:predicted RNA-binding protein
MRPEIVRYQKRLRERYSPPPEAEILILLPRPPTRPFHRAREVKQLRRRLTKEFPENRELFHVCIYAPPFGVVPFELDEIYPLSQHEIAFPLDHETMSYVAERMMEFISSHSYKEVVLIEDDKPWSHEIAEACKEIKRKDLSITIIRVEKPSERRILDDVFETLRRMVV